MDQGAEIRMQIKLSGISSKEVAECVGIHPTTLSYWLHKGATAENYQRVLDAVGEIQRRKAEEGAAADPDARPINRMRVIAGLTRCARNDLSQCKLCPYYARNDCDGLLIDALAYIKRLEQSIKDMKTDMGI